MERLKQVTLLKSLSMFIMFFYYGKYGTSYGTCPASLLLPILTYTSCTFCITYLIHKL